MKTKNKGFTLLEVIVSIVILAVISSMVLTLYASYKRITTKLTIREKIVNVVDETFNKFTNDYKEYSELSDGHKIYYNSVIDKVDEETGNYIVFHYSEDSNYRTLEIDIYINGEPYEVGGTSTFRRTIYEEE